MKNSTVKNIGVLIFITVITVSNIIFKTINFDLFEKNSKLALEIGDVKSQELRGEEDNKNKSLKEDMDSKNNNNKSINKNNLNRENYKNSNEKNSEDIESNIFYKKMKKLDEAKQYIDKEENKESVDESIRKYHENKDLNDIYKNLFKMKTFDIMDNLSEKEKKYLLGMSKYLSISDYNKLLGNLYDKDQKKGIIDALQLVKNQVPENEYFKIRDIADKFVNMEILDLYLK